VLKAIRKKLIVRLFIGWLALSVVICLVVFFVEMEHIDEFVKDLAMNESKLLFHNNMHCINSADHIMRRELERKVREYIAGGHFIVIEVYDKSLKRIIEIHRSGSSNVEEYLEKQNTAHELTDEITYDRFYFDDGIYLQVFAPLKTPSGVVVGHFEGIYQVDATSMKQIKHRVFGSIGLVILSILVTAVMLYPIIIGLTKNLIKLTADLSHANIGMLAVLGGAIAKRDSDTNAHNYRVTIYAVRLARIFGLSRENLRRLVKGSFLHDIGKIGITDNILLKPGKLTDEEFDAMKMHVQHGMDIIGKYDWLADAVDVVACHHEKYDGTGYPEGLKGEEIDIGARIFAIADVFDALTSMRPYKEPFSFEKAMGIIEENSGSHFDPRLVEAFKRIAPGLYHETTAAAEKDLEKTLNAIIADYFKL
jgi:HD-GYP domain-containing protein (c-di-GMP phosphodiesterase class II)